MSKMTKRKAGRVNFEPDETNSSGTQSRNQSQSQSSQQPSAFNEKRKRLSPETQVKRFSRHFSDLSQLNDLNQTNAESEQSLSNENKTKAPCAGVIEKIHLKNFKCHSSLDFEFHPYINFILGRNGSGKSAIMDAIVLCLGGRAAATGRQASAKTFIKTNCDKAELSITIANIGEEAYRPNDYGCRITIERKLSKDGTSGYRLLNDKNKVVSVKKQEVDNIVEQFNIQVDNPVCFLNQETSKHFLNSSNKSDKYKFFMKASQLESMKRIQEQAECERQLSLQIIQDKESNMPKLSDALFVLEEKFKRCQSVEKLRQRLGVLMQEFSWTVVINSEKLIEAANREKQALIAKKDKLESKFLEAKNNFELTNTAYEEIKANIANLNSKSKSDAAEYEKVNVAFKNASQNYKHIQNELKKVQVLLDRKSREYNSVNEKLNEEKNSNERDNEEERKQKELKISGIKKEQAKCTEIEKFKVKDNQMYVSAIEQAQRQISDKRFEIKNLENLRNNLTEDIKNLNKSTTDKIYRFGPYMKELVMDVKKSFDQGRFKQMPRGPIGMYIEPRDHSYAIAIEQCIGSLMQSFVCENYEDEKLMHQLINKHVRPPNQKPRVIVNDFSTPLYDANRFRPEFTDYPTVYEMLTITDNVVANVLFDQRRIESILILPDRTHSHIIEKNSTQNCNEAFLLNGDQLLGLPSFRLYGCRAKNSSYFVERPQEAIQQKQAEIDRLREPINRLRESIEELNEQIASNKNLKAQNDKQLDSIKREQLKLNSQLREAEAINIPEPFDLMAFEEELSKLKQDMSELNVQIIEINTNSIDLKTAYDDSKTELEKWEREIKIHSSNFDEMHKNYKQIDENRAQHKEAMAYYEKLYDEQVAKMNEKQSSIAQQERELEKVTAAAMELSPRIETKRSSKTVDNEVQNIEKQLAQSAKLHGNEEEITRQYIEMKSKYNKLVEDIKKQNAFLMKLKEVLEKRAAAAYLFTQGKALRCAMYFSNYLRSRNYNGNLIFNHEEQKLDVIVQPNVARAEAETRDLKSLSGGERSFSTVAFLLSLWSIVESPILFLDEFDVFMDQVNRRFAMELLLSSAKDNLNGQYLFLTPQEMGYIKPDLHVKMYKMPDPKRTERNYDDQENN